MQDDLISIQKELFLSQMDIAETYFKTLSTATIHEKEAMSAALGNAWRVLAAIRRMTSRPEELDTQCAGIARIALLRGKCLWASDDMEVSRKLFTVSLLGSLGRTEQLFSLPGINEEETLENFLKWDLSDVLEDELSAVIPSDAIIREALDLGEEAALAVASAARDLGGTYQNHTGYKISGADTEAEKERKIQLCENAIRIADTLWEVAGTDEARWLQLTSRYNTGPYLYGLRNPQDISGKVAIYNDVLVKLKELEARGATDIKFHQQRAQCYNMLAIVQGETLSDAERYELISRSAEIALEFVNDGFDVFLSRMFPHNRASFAFKCLEKGTPIEGVTIGMIDLWHDHVQVMCEKQGYSHFYDAIFCLNAAKAARYLGNEDKCGKLVSKALEVCAEHPNSTADILANIEAFQKSTAMLHRL